MTIPLRIIVVISLNSVHIVGDESLADSERRKEALYIESVWDFQRSNALFEQPSVQRFLTNPDIPNDSASPAEKGSSRAPPQEAIYSPLDACTYRIISP